MKVTASETKSSFQPISLTITLETKKELDVFASLFNTCCVVDTCDKMTGTSDVFDDIRYKLQPMGATMSLANEITALIRKHPSL